MRYHTRVEKFFSDTEREAIRQAVAGAESSTAGEIAVVVVDKSDEYPEAEIAGAVFLGGLVSLAVTVLFFHASLWMFIPLLFILFFPARVLMKKAPVLKRPLVGERRKAIEVQERALMTFYEKGLHKTEGHTGVLFYLSLLEKKVWILADQGIHGHLDDDLLGRLAHTVTEGIRQGHACDALCRAISEIGAVLSAYYPIKVGDKNELPDEVIVIEQD